MGWIYEKDKKTDNPEFYEGLKRAGEINAGNLSEILYDNRDTDYGKKYDFCNISSEKDFRERVPLTDYGAYADMAEYPSRYTAYPVRDILMTSGTTGVPKKFALTYKALSRYPASALYHMPFTFCGGREGPHLHTSVFRPAVNGERLLSSAFYSWLAENGIFNCDAYLGGEKLLFSDCISNIPYVKAWLLLSCPRVVSIQSIFLYDILLLFAFLEENWETILTDMENRRVSAELKASVKEALLSCIPEDGWIQNLRREFSGGFGKPVASRIWKGLKFVSGIGGEVYQVWEDKLKGYLGDVPVYYFAYASSECMAGISVEMDKAEYALMPQSAYYEFLSADGEVVSLENLQIGGEYEPVITTFSGLYRYRTGDRIKIKSFLHKAPVFSLIGRKGNYLNIAGEKLDEETIRESVLKWAAECGIVFHDFSMGIDACSLPGFYRLFVETGEEQEDVHGMEDAFDGILCGLSPDYADVRGLGMVGSPHISFLERDEIRRSVSGDNSHSKPHMILNEKQVEVLAYGNKRTAH